MLAVRKFPRISNMEDNSSRKESGIGKTNMEDNSSRKESGIGKKMSTQRGIAWRHREVSELLALWGDARVQQTLRASHRNFDCFERISEGMADRGFNRSAQECRTKTKSMRLQYKRCYTHNQRSGNNPQFCPYYQELHSILKGDASVAPFRVADSISITRRVEPTKPVSPETEEFTGELLTTVNLRDIEEHPQASTSVENEPVLFTDETQSGSPYASSISDASHQGGVECHAFSDETRVDCSPSCSGYSTTSQSHGSHENVHPDEDGDLEDMSRKSPASRLRNIHERKRRRPMSARVLLQGAKEHEELITLNKIMHEEVCKMHRERQEEQRQRWKAVSDEQRERWRVESEEQRVFQASMDRGINIMDSLAKTLIALSAQEAVSTTSRMNEQSVESTHIVGSSRGTPDCQPTTVCLETGTSNPSLCVAQYSKVSSCTVATTTESLTAESCSDTQSKVCSDSQSEVGTDTQSEVGTDTHSEVNTLPCVEKRGGKCSRKTKHTRINLQHQCTDTSANDDAQTGSSRGKRTTKRKMYASDEWQQ